MVRFYLGEEPLLEPVKTWGLSTPRTMNAALDRLDERVVKPRAGFGDPNGERTTLDGSKLWRLALLESYGWRSFECERP